MKQETVLREWVEWVIFIALFYFMGAWLLDFPLPNWNVDIFKGLF
jgi:hypothetical protein